MTITRRIEDVYSTEIKDKTSGEIWLLAVESVSPVPFCLQPGQISKDVEIAGLFGDPVANISFSPGGIIVVDFSRDSDTKITAEIALQNSALGSANPWDVSVTSGGIACTGADLFNVVEDTSGSTPFIWFKPEEYEVTYVGNNTLQMTGLRGFSSPPSGFSDYWFWKNVANPTVAGDDTNVDVDWDDGTNDSWSQAAPTVGKQYNYETNASPYYVVTTIQSYYWRYKNVGLKECLVAKGSDNMGLVESASW